MARSDFASSITYSEESDFSFDSNYIEFDSGVKLNLINNPGQDFTEDFADDTGFTYDSDLLEFSGVLLQQKMNVLSSAIAGVNYYEDANADFMFGNGTLTGTLTNGTVLNGVLDLKGTTGDRKYCDYLDGGSILSGSELKGTLIIDWIPNWTGTPSGIRGICLIKNPANYNWMINFMYQNSDSKLYVYVYNGSGASTIVLNAAFSPVAGQSYELAISWDFEVEGRMSLYADKTRIATAQSAGYLTTFASRVWTDMDIRIGTDTIAAWYADCEIDDIIIYNDCLLTDATYSEDYAMPDYLYAETYATLPEMEYTGAGTLVVIDSFTTTQANSNAQFGLQVGRSGNYLYWTGSAWAISDNTYTQSTSQANFNTNCGTLDIDGEIYGQFRVYFPNSNTQGSIDELTVSLTAQIYPVTNPEFTTASSLTADELLSIVLSETISGSDMIKYAIKRDDAWLYWDGSAWSTSSSYATASTSSDIEDNIASINNDDENDYYLKGYLHSNDGTTTPTFASAIIKYFILNFVVEDGTGKSDATSYATLAQFYQYWIDKGTDYSSTSTTDIKQWLNSATEYLDISYKYRGERTNDDQALDWPRYYVEKEKRGLYYEDNEIPIEIVDACCYLAAKVADGELNAITNNLRSYTIGPVSKTYSGSSNVTEYTIIDKLLKHLIIHGNELVRVK